MAFNENMSNTIRGFILNVGVVASAKCPYASKTLITKILNMLNKIYLASSGNHH